jgi:cell division protein FtsN
VRRLLTRAAVIVPVLIALALVPFNDRLFKGKMEESTLNPLANAELEFNREQIAADTAYIESEPVVTEATVIGTVVTEEPVMEPSVAVPPAPAAFKPVQQAVVVQEYRYMLIIGSFKTEDNALTMIEKLRKIGYDPEMTGGPDGFLRVSAVSYGTVEEAKTAHGKLIRDFPGAWIHKSRE